MARPGFFFRGRRDRG